MDESTLFLRVIAHYAKAFWFIIIAGLFLYNSGVVRSWGAEAVSTCQFQNLGSYDIYDCEIPIWSTLGMLAMWIGSIVFLTKAVGVAKVAHEGLRVIEED
jgi:hypothetical protein